MKLSGLLARVFGPSQKRISAGLSDAFRDADTRTLELSKVKAVVFSDHHRGQGDGADDFARCEGAYCAALGWYLEHGYELWLLGDVEELWENRPTQVMGRYAEVLALERSFGDRLWRFYGNHDMAWNRDGNVDSFLSGWLPDRERLAFADNGMREAARVVVTDDGDPLGTLFLAHGHQGTIDSGNLLVVPFSRLVVRFVWGTLQRMQKFPSTSPSSNAVLRGHHDRAMATWADNHEERLVLIAGHTHRPVFPGTEPPDVDAEAAAAQERYQDALRERREVPAARAECELARVRALREEDYVPPDLKRPCYFNTGCCSFGDGDVTGLELCEGKIRLVRWLDDANRARPQQLEKPLELRSVLGGLSGAAPAVR